MSVCFDLAKTEISSVSDSSTVYWRQKVSRLKVLQSVVVQLFGIVSLLHLEWDPGSINVLPRLERPPQLERPSE